MCLPGPRRREVGDRVVGRGRLDQAGQHRGLGPAEPGRPDAEVTATRRAQPVVAIPEVGDIRIHLEDLRSRVGQGQLDAQAHLFRLDGYARPSRRVQHLGQLLVQGGAALVRAAAEPADNQPADSERIDARLRIEPVIFGGHQGRREPGGYVGPGVGDVMPPVQLLGAGLRVADRRGNQEQPAQRQGAHQCQPERYGHDAGKPAVAAPGPAWWHAACAGPLGAGARRARLAARGLPGIPQVRAGGQGRRRRTVPRGSMTSHARPVIITGEPEAAPFIPCPSDDPTIVTSLEVPGSLPTPGAVPGAGRRRVALSS